MTVANRGKTDRTPPTAGLCGEPTRVQLPAGTALWRVHEARFPANEYCPVPSENPFGGGRFDAIAKDFVPFLYAAFTPETALCETVLRNLDTTEGSRQLSRREVEGRCLSRLTTTSELTLLSLASRPELWAVCQPDFWLVRAEALEYFHTRLWASWIRQHVEDVDGFRWISAQDSPAISLVFYSGAAADADVAPAVQLPATIEESIALGDRAGAQYINIMLAPYGVTVAEPLADSE